MKIINFLSSEVLRNLFIKICATVGVSFISYVGLESVLLILKEKVMEAFDNSIAEAGLSFAGMLGVDIALNYMFAGYTTALAISTLKKFKLV